MPPDQTTEPTAQELWNDVSTELRDGAAPGGTQQGSQPQAVTPVEAPAPAPAEVPPISPLELRIQELAALVDTQGALLRTATGRIGALQSALDKAQVQAPAPAPTEQPKLDRWKRLAEEYPEMGAAVEELVNANKPAAPATTLDPDDVREIVDKTFEAKQAERVSERFPGWEARVRTPAFKEWKSRQPAEVQALGASMFAEDAIALLQKFDEYATSPSGITATRDEVLTSATRGRPGPQPDRVDPGVSGVVLTEQQIWEEEARLRAKRRAESQAA